MRVVVHPALGGADGHRYGIRIRLQLFGRSRRNQYPSDGFADLVIVRTETSQALTK